MMVKLSVCLLAAVFVVAVHSAPLSKAKLRFKVSARNLPDEDTGFGTTDGYFILYSSEDGGRTKTKIARSDTISDKENPDWGSSYDFDFDRNKNQWWFFYLYDEDNLREDETVGRVWINVADYVDKGQLVQANLDKKRGYLIVKSIDNQPQPAPDTPAGIIPLAAGIPKSQTLRFKVSASGLPTKDDIGFIPGTSDPYVVITSVDGVSGKERDVGRTTTISSSSNPNWGDVLTFNWDQSKDQRLRFKIYDDDKLREDDKLGTGWIEVNDYVAKGQTYTLPMPKKGFLTITKA
jgi:Ca2+-dependent lipid-binding protein